MENLVKDYVETSKALQKKYEEIRFGAVTRRKRLEDDFTPLVKPLREISAKLGPTMRVRNSPEEISEIGPLAEKYLLRRGDSNEKRDTKFGIYSENGEYFVGNKKLKIVQDNIDFGSDLQFEGTPGLWELLTLEKPKNWTQDDLNNYEKIVISTYTYRRDNDPNSKYVKSSGGYKYMNFIKHIVNKYNRLKIPPQRQQHSGSDTTPSRPSPVPSPLTVENSQEEQEEGQAIIGSGLTKILTNAPVEYVYWNTLDELLDRLYIVYGEIKSGNNNPNLLNELVNILQEIKEL